MTFSSASTSAPLPVPLAIARSMLSLGIEASLAFWMASWSDGLPSGSPPPSLAATVIDRASFVKSLPRRASTIAFLCLIPAHLECPAMRFESMKAVGCGAAASRRDWDRPGRDVRDAERADDERLAPEGRAQVAERAAQRREAVARAEGDEVRARAPDDVEAGALEHPVEGGDVGLPPPGLVDAVEARDGGARAQQTRDELDGLAHHQRPAGHGVDALERADRVAQVQQQRA